MLWNIGLLVHLYHIVINNWDSKRLRFWANPCTQATGEYILTRLLALYPTGSLISELLQIHEGKFVVRASVQVDGVTRATGLAAVETLELAEDRARSRALMVLLPELSASAQPEIPARPPTVISEVQPVVKQSLPSAEADKKQPSPNAAHLPGMAQQVHHFQQCQRQKNQH